MRHLGQDSHAVAGLSFSVLSGTVLQVLHNLQGIFHGCPGFGSFDVYAGTNAAVVMLKLLSIKRCFGNFLFHIKHNLTPLPVRFNLCSSVITYPRDTQKRPQRDLNPPLCDLWVIIKQFLSFVNRKFF